VTKVLDHELRLSLRFDWKQSGGYAMSKLIDNRAQRVRALKDVITHLHNGMPTQEVKAKLKTLLRETDHSEIMAMEQELMAHGMRTNEIQRICDLHSQVAREVLVTLPGRTLTPGHPIDSFCRENDAVSGVLARLRLAMNETAEHSDPTRTSSSLLDWQQSLNELMDLEKHYQRKEQLLFSCLERHGVAGPSKVMWGKDDEIRALLKNLARALRAETEGSDWASAATATGEAAASAIEEMIYKEEKILFPLCLDKFTDEEWGKIWESSPRYGWCLVEPREGFRPPISSKAGELQTLNATGIQLPTGYLSIDQLRSIFSTLPVDITFVNANERVAFFSEGPDRLFARSKAVIGRKVQNCHPPRSVDIVNRILNDFREGKQDAAEFWINLRGRFVHIRYFAVRGEENRYLGTLEVTQDVTSIHALEGERRLLQYDTPEAQKVKAQ
jgi:uncharacterized protein